MKIVLVGAGNLACSLGRALFEAGNDILQVYSRTCQAASALADALDASPVTEIDRISADADVYIVAVKDSVMADIVPSLCHGKEGKVFLHTSGSVAASVFEGRALHYGVLYPMQTFSKSKPLAFKDIPCFIEGSDEFALETVSKLAHSLSDSVLRLDSEARKHLHLAAVFACNFANHCYEISSEILAKYGIPFEVMLPLIDETARKVHVMRPYEAQTGPAVRYDKNVIGMQAGLLEDNVFFRKVYESMSDSIHHVAQKEIDHRI